MSAEDQVLSLGQPEGEMGMALGRCVFCGWANGAEGSVSWGGAGGFASLFAWPGDGHSPVSHPQVKVLGSQVGPGICMHFTDATAGGGVGALV